MKSLVSKEIGYIPTRFGRFITSKFFSKIFLLFFLLFTSLAANETNSALCFLLGRKHLFGIVYLIFAIVAFFVFFKKNISKRWYNKLFKKTMSVLSCFIIYYAPIFLLWELMCLVFSFGKSVKSVGVLGVILVAGGIVIGGYLYTKIITIKNYHITLGKGKENYKVALVSDIHLGIFVGEKHVERIVRKLNAMSADIVVISGDIFDVDNSLLKDTERLKRISKHFQKIKSREGVYAVVGNHDPKTTNQVFLRFLRDSKIRLLDNDVKVLSKINLIGRTDGTNNIRTDFDALISKTDADKPMIVLDHNPNNIKESVQNHVDLVLCGHTHRGQLFPINLFTKWANGKRYFYGYEKFGTTHAVITSGVGFFELPVRICSSNEIAELQIKL